MRPLSYSSISTYEQCPLKWKFHYIDKLPEEPKPYFSFGTVMHDVMEFFYMEKEGGKIKGPRFDAPSVDELLAYYRSVWLSEGYENSEQEENYRALGERIIREYHSEHAGNFRMPIATEHGFMLEVRGIKVRGFIDRVDKLGPESVAILDYKTSKNAFTIPYVKSNKQLALYQMAFEELHNKRVERLSLYHLRSNMDFSVGRRPDSMISALKDEIAEVADAIEGENFEPKRSWLCDYCDYQRFCPYFRDLYEERTEEKTDIEDAVEEYVRLSSEMARLDRRKKELYSVLRNYAEKNGLMAIFGKRSALTVSHYERIEYDEKVKDILKEAGLLERAVKIDNKALKELIKAGEIDKDTAETIESYRRSKEITSLRKRRMKEEEMDVS